jgi:glycosyltransferase involved in cell wall biosynthesis
LKSGGFDLIHIHLWNPGSCRYAFFAASHFGIPIVVTEHDPFELSGLKKLIKQNCVKKTAQTITISSLNFRLLGEYYGVSEKRLNLVTNGIEVDMFLDNIEKAELPVEKGKIIVTSIGELHHRKGHKYLLEAFRKLRIESPNVHLVLVGTGPSEYKYKEEFSDLNNVTFLGWRDDIPQILKASDIFILPSLREAFGLVILEAMASGVVVIATNSGGATDIIKDGITGYIIPPSNSDRIVEAIFEIIRNPDKKRQMEIAAIDSVRKNFTAEIMANKTVDVYNKLATNK